MKQKSGNKLINNTNYTNAPKKTKTTTKKPTTKQQNLQVLYYRHQINSNKINLFLAEILCCEMWLMKCQTSQLPGQHKVITVQTSVLAHKPRTGGQK